MMQIIPMRNLRIEETNFLSTATKYPTEDDYKTVFIVYRDFNEYEISENDSDQVLEQGYKVESFDKRLFAEIFIEGIENRMTQIDAQISESTTERLEGLVLFNELKEAQDIIEYVAKDLLCDGFDSIDVTRFLTNAVEERLAKTIINEQEAPAENLSPAGLT